MSVFPARICSMGAGVMSVLFKIATLPPTLLPGTLEDLILLKLLNDVETEVPLEVV